MAKIGIFASVIAKLKFKGQIEIIQKKVGRKEFMLQIGEQIKTLIQGDTRSGKGVDSKGNQETLTVLSDTYIEYRRKQKGFRPGRFFKPAFSNLTLTGQMIDSIDVEARQSFVKVFVKDTGRRDDSGLTNKRVSELVAENGRPFMGLTKRNRRTVDKEIERETRAIIRRELARK